MQLNANRGGCKYLVIPVNIFPLSKSRLVTYLAWCCSCSLPSCLRGCRLWCGAIEISGSFVADFCGSKTRIKMHVELFPVSIPC